IPTDLRVGRRRSFSPATTIAAAIALFAVVLGLGFLFNSRASAPQFQAKQQSEPEQKTIAVQPQPAPINETSQAAAVKSPGNNQKRYRAATRNLLASDKTPLIRRDRTEPELTSQELAEKEQLLVALRLVSAKLNLAQRRTQGAPPSHNIRNQHKIG
ncbi:MAG: hypothetical protein ACMG6H_11595, partial [Acidobacteriota bacterium]